MAKKFSAFLILGLLGFTFFGWSLQEDQEGKKAYINITPHELFQMLKQKDFILINVHIPYVGEIPQTDLFIPYDEIKKHVDKLPQKKDKKIVVYCRSDRMSKIASAALAQIGYMNILNLKGGIVAWKEAGYDLIQREKKNE